MERHVKILGMLYVVIGGFGVAATLILLGVFGGVAGVVRMGERSEAWPLITLLWGVAVLAMSAPAVIAGIGLLCFKPWARVLTIMLSVIHLLSVPFGTALVVYGLWVLLQREAEPLFSRA